MGVASRKMGRNKSRRRKTDAKVPTDHGGAQEAVQPEQSVVSHTQGS